MPNLRVQNLGGSLKVLFVNNTDLTRDRRYTFLSEDVTAAGSTFRVQSILGFESVTTSSGQVVMIGEPGAERTEIRRTTNASADGYPSESYKEIGLRDTLKFDHPQDTKVYIIDWDRIEFQVASSVTGTKATILAYPAAIQPDMRETVQRDTTESESKVGTTTAFYFARFNNTIDSRNSDWSDATYGTGFDDNMVGSIKRRALEELGEVVDGNIITHEFLNSALWEARREYHKAPGKRPFRRKFNVDIGNAFTGSFRIELPTDVEKSYGAENVYGVRIGANANMEWYDKKEWDFDYRNTPHTTLANAYNTGARDLYVANARDFAESGVVSIEGTNVTYSEKSNSGGTLRISDDGEWNGSAGSDVWQNVSYGLPSRFAVWADPEGSAYIYFNTPIDTMYGGMNIYADYYRTLVGYNSDGDTLDEPEYDMYVDYLKAKIKHRKNKGESDMTKDPDFKMWLLKKATALSTEYLSTELRISPDVDHLQIPE